MSNRVAVPGSRRSPIPPQSEKTFQAAIVELAELLHWRVFHTFDSRRSAAGFPDLVMVRSGRLVCFECKREGATTTDAQKEWLAALQTVGGNVEAYAVRPSDWDEIVRILGGPRL